MSDLSIFVDESGGEKGRSQYCIVTLVFHDQSQDIANAIVLLERDIAAKGLQSDPFHASPLMYGKAPYKGMSMASRKRILSAFEAFCRRVPFAYQAFAYRRSEVELPGSFVARFKKDLVLFLSENLEFFQSYDQVKIYYDNGQRMVTKALHQAIDYMLSKQAVMYKMADPRAYRLSQIADYICTLELTDLKFKSGGLTNTDFKVFGGNYPAFKKNHLRHIRRKMMS